MGTETKDKDRVPNFYSVNEMTKNEEKTKFPEFPKGERCEI